MWKPRAVADRTTLLELYELTEVGNCCLYAGVGVLERSAMNGASKELACNGSLGDKAIVAAVG